MDRLAHRVALAATGALLAALGVLPGAANATDNAYCGVLINNGTWCGDGTDHAYTTNSATYSGGGMVWVCERLLIANTSTQREGPGCGYNYVSQSFASYVWLTEAEVAHYTGTQHTIGGLGKY
jgi:hypothetical protein